jgi:predicted permease
VLGDLQEDFETIAQSESPRAARRWYWSQVIRSLPRSLRTFRPDRTGSYEERGRLLTGGRRIVSTLVQDVVFAVRLHRGRLGTVVTVAGALALAIGLATAAISVMNGVLFRQMNLGDAPLLRWVDPTPIPNQAAGLSVIPRWTYAEYRELEARTRQSRLAGFVQSAARLDDDAASSGSPSAESPGLPVWFVSEHFFEVVGAPLPSAGRWLTAADQMTGGPAAVVVGHAFWSRQLGADARIVGESIRLNGRPFIVAGVGPPGFAGPDATQPAFWAALGAYDHDWRDGSRLAPSSDVPVRVLARLPEPDRAGPVEDELRALVAGLPSRQPVSEGATLLSLSAIDDESQVLYADQISLVVKAVLALLLLLACGNVSNLLVASGLTRRAELATRLALGARGRIVRQLTTEGLVLMLAAASGGWLLAAWLAPLLASLVEGYPTVDVRPDGRALAFLIGTSTAIGLLASLLPAIVGSRGDLRTPIGDGPGMGSPRLQRLGALVIGGQAALGVVLILLAVLLTRAAWRGAEVDPGFDADRLATALALTPFMPPDEARATKFDIVNRLRELPGIEDATVARFSPLAGSRRSRQANQDGTRYSLIVKPVSPEYFRVTGIRITRGTTVPDAAITGETRLAVIEERLARRFWGDAEPIGSTLARLRDDLADVRVAGVAADVLPYGLTDHGRDTSALYLPMTLDDYRLGAVVVRTASPATTEAIRQALAVAAPGRRANISVMGATLRGQVEGIRMPARLASVAAAAVVGLAVVGIYGLAALRVRQRVREIGVRMALGATRSDLIRRLLQDGLRPIVIGTLAGVGLAALALRLVSSLLLGLQTYDPASVATSAGVLVVFAALAIGVASRRAAGLSPSVALRHE